MTPVQRNYAEWRISVWQFMLKSRKVSTVSAIREHAALCEREAKMLQSVINTPIDALSAEQRIWNDWICSAADLYQAAHREADYWQRADNLREVRDALLAPFHRRAA